MARGCSMPPAAASVRPCHWAERIDAGESTDLRLPPIRSRQARRPRARSTTTGKMDCSAASPRSREVHRLREMIEESRQRLLSQGPSVPSRIQLVCTDEEAAATPLQRKALPVRSITGDAVWVSVSPRSGKVQLYPRSAAERLEDAYFRRRKCTALCGLGLNRRLEEAIVHLDGERPVQCTRRGVRDVRRLELGRLDDVAGIPTVEVISGENGWRICDTTVEGMSQIRCLPSDWTTDAVAVQKLWQPVPPPRHRMAATA